MHDAGAFAGFDGGIGECAVGVPGVHGLTEQVDVTVKQRLIAQTDELGAKMPDATHSNLLPFRTVSAWLARRIRYSSGFVVAGNFVYTVAGLFTERRRRIGRQRPRRRRPDHH